MNWVDHVFLKALVKPQVDFIDTLEDLQDNVKYFQRFFKEKMLTVKIFIEETDKKR